MGDNGGRERVETERRARGAGRSRRSFLATGAAVALASLGGCAGDGGTDGDGGSGDGGSGSTGTGTAGSPDEVVIGSVHPFTGSTSYVGTRLHNAVELAAEMANENGGVESLDGAEVRVIKGDHKNDPALAGEVTRELIDQGADILTGTYSSPVTNAATQVAESQGVPFVIDVSVAASLLQARDMEYVYRPHSNSWDMASDSVAGLQSVADQADLDVQTAGLFYVDTSYGQAIRDGLKRAFEDTNIEITATATIGFGETADTQVTRFRQADPDVLVPTVFSNQMLELVGSMQDQGYWPDIFAALGSGGMTTDNFQQMGEVINGALASGYKIDPSKERAQQVNQRFMNTYDTAPMVDNVAMAFTTAEVMIAAAEQAASTDADALNGALQSLTVEDHIMAMPPISFDDAGENENSLSVVDQVQDQRARIVYPDEYATVDVVTDTIGPS